MDDKFDYISQMVQDTMSSVEEDNVLKFPLDLSPQTKNHDADSEQLSFDFDTYPISLDLDRGCISIYHNDKSLEIPVNWGAFKSLEMDQKEFYTYLDKESDNDYLLEVLSEFYQFEVSSFELCGQGGSCKLSLNKALSIADAA